MRKTLAVARKELVQIARDPLSLIMLVGLPAVLLVLYGFALNFDVRHVNLAVQDRDHSTSSRDLISAFVNSTYFDIVATPAAGENVEILTDEGRARAILVIPEGFGRDLAAGRVAPVQLLLDGADSLTATTVMGYAGALAAEHNVRLMTQALQRHGQTAHPPLDLEPRVWYNPELESTRFLVPGLIGFLMMLTGVVATALSVVRESERGTMEQLRMAPIHNGEVILGKSVPYLVLSYLAAIIVLAAARLLFGVVVRGPYWALFLVTLVYLVGAVSFGLLVSTIANSQAMAFQVGLLTSLLPAILLSGFIFQIRLMPGWLQMVTRLVPARYYLIVLRGIILKGAGLAPYWPEMTFLTLFAALALTLASVRMARREV
jgi:ABC-2 type transport system permease protein